MPTKPKDRSGGGATIIHGVDADRAHDERQHIAPVHQVLHILGAAEQQHQRGHEERGVEKRRAEAREKAPMTPFRYAGAENKTHQKAVQQPGHEALHKGEKRRDAEEDRAHAAGDADADALEKAQQPEHAADDGAASGTERDGGDGDGDEERDGQRTDGDRPMGVEEKRTTSAVIRPRIARARTSNGFFSSVTSCCRSASRRMQYSVFSSKRNPVRRRRGSVSCQIPLGCLPPLQAHYT